MVYVYIWNASNLHDQGKVIGEKKSKNLKNLIFGKFSNLWSWRLEYYSLYFLDFFNHKEQ